MLKNLAWFGGLVILPLALFALLTTLTLPAQAQGEPGHIVIGTAQANGSPVAAGSTVTAWGGDEQIGSATTTEGGHFTIQISRTSGAIRFKVNGVFANETIPSWQQGGRTGSSSDRFVLTFDEMQSPYYPCREIAIKTQGEPPHIFIGAAKADGSPVPAGKCVPAWDGDTRIGLTLTTAGGNFTLQVSRPSGSISFQVDGVTANETYSHWQQGGHTGSHSNRFILTTGEADPDATPWPSPTPTPTPTTPYITLSDISGPPGSGGIIRGSNFKPFVPLKSLLIGGIDITSQWPYETNGQGSIEIDFIIPGLSPGDYAVETDIGSVATSVNFTVTESECTLAAGTPSPTIFTLEGYSDVSQNSGAPGIVITVRGTGFKAIMPVRRVEFGSIDVRPVPEPWTYCNGETRFDILIPDLAPGQHTIEVEVAGSTASVDFTVTPPPTITLSANSGAVGSTITLHGEGFEPFVKVQSVSVGGIHVLERPVPSTDEQGVTEFDIRIPEGIRVSDWFRELTPGKHTIVVTAPGGIASAEFTVTAESPPTPTPRPTATPYPTPTPTPLPAATPTPAPTTDPPQLPGSSEPPHIFTGQATLNGSPAGQGIAIDAYDGGRLIGATVTQAGGRYTIHVHRSAGIITFRVNQQAAAESWTTWQQGQVTPGFNLTAAAGSSESDPSRLFAALPDLVRAFAFDNATKQWDFFDPVVPEVSTLTRFVPGNTYWLLVSQSAWLLLNEVERNLTCVGDNCWNLIVW